MKSFLTTSTALLSIFFTFSASANGVGNGGDAIRSRFEQAQVSAPQLVAQVLPCSFHQTIPSNVRDWILKNQSALVQDLRLTQLKWIVDLQGTCANTALTPAANVYLSYNECRQSTQSMEDAIFTLIHESVHHFNVTDEGFADAIAQTILYGTDQRNSCPVLNSPFDSDYCQRSPMTLQDAVARFTPGTTKVDLNQSLQMMVRSRDCQVLTGCAPWSDGGAQVGHMGGASGVVPFTSISSSLVIGNSNHMYLSLNKRSSIYPTQDYAQYNLDDLKLANRYTFFYAFIDSTHYGTIDNDFAESKITNQCLWVKFKKGLDMGNGVTREVEFVLSGNH